MEDVRMGTFGRKGFQQIQIDVEYLRVQLIRYISDEGLLSTLLNQVLSSVYRRCTDPLPLETMVRFKLLTRLMYALGSRDIAHGRLMLGKDVIDASLLWICHLEEKSTETRTCLDR